MLKTTKNRTKLRFVNGSFVQVELPNFSSIYIYVYIYCFCYVYISCIYLFLLCAYNFYILELNNSIKR